MQEIQRKRNSIEFRVFGDYALFSDPITRVGGEKMSYLIPTYEAIKGIAQSIYWKPSIIWFIDAVRIMKKIQTQSKSIKTLKMNNNASDLSYYTYLHDVEYQVLAHFEWNTFRPELKNDWNENKHHNIAKRSVSKGGRRDIFLGTRECQGYVEPCVFGENVSAYDDAGEISFGPMFHGFDYPDETGREMLSIRMWRSVMKNGIIMFPAPKDCPKEMKRDIRPMKMKEFSDTNNFTLIDNDVSISELFNDNKEE